MKKWLTHIIEASSVDAVSKSRSDITAIGDKTDHKPLYIYRYVDPNESEEALNSRIDGITAAVSQGDLVIYQYPSYNGGNFELAFIRRMKLRGIRVAILVHDSELLRGSGYNDEKELFCMVDALIVHGKEMEDKLREFGVHTLMVQKSLFDYLVDGPYAKLSDELARKIVFAGNIRKSTFLGEWIPKTNLIAFGRKGEMVLSEKVEYGGEFQQEDLIRVMPKDCFGIAWDNNLDQGGAYQDYTRYNAPHKVSLYLSLGLPVFVWKESSAATIVQKYQLGFAIDSLSEIDGILDNMSDEELRALKRNVNNFSRVLRQGLFTRNAFLEIETKLIFQEVNINHEN